MFKIYFKEPLKNAYQVSEEEAKDYYLINCNKEGKNAQQNCLNYQIQEKVKEKFHIEKLEKELELVLKLFKEMIKEIEEEKAKMVAEGKKEIIKVAVAIAKKIIKKETQIDPDIILRVAESAFKQIIDAKKIVVKVNPNDKKKIKEMIDLKKEKSNIQIEEDERVQRGGCLITTDKEIVDAQIDHQIKEVEKALMEIESE